MRIGCHVSISGSIDRAVDNAVSRGCTAFQIFTRSPRSWHAKPLAEKEISTYRSKLENSHIDRTATVTHMPYLPNLANPNRDAFERSVATIADEVKRCGQLGIPYLVTHLGSHLGTGEEAGINRLADGLQRAAEVDNDVTILLENTAGQKNSVGSRFEQWAQILRRAKPARRFGVCLDSCHAFAAGYDLRTQEAVRKTMAEFDKTIGYKRLKIFHLNDSKGACGSNRDRHEHIGLGEIGRDGMAELVMTAASRDIPLILETPIDSTRTDVDNIRAAQDMWDGQSHTAIH